MIGGWMRVWPWGGARGGVARGVAFVFLVMLAVASCVELDQEEGPTEALPEIGAEGRDDADGNGTLDILEDADGDGIPNPLEDDDGDTVTNVVDRCPTQVGLPASHGCPDSTASGTAMDAIDILWLIFRERAEEQNDDKKFMLEKLGEYNKVGEALSDSLSDLSAAARDLDRNAGTAWEYGDTDLNGLPDVFEDSDGTLNLLKDADGNGTPDILEDADGDGIPNPLEDDDGDTVTNVVDRCPTEMGFPDSRGCPDSTASSTAIKSPPLTLTLNPSALAA